jgi:hypothetical protein
MTGKKGFGEVVFNLNIRIVCFLAEMPTTKKIDEYCLLRGDCPVW